MALNENITPEPSAIVVVPFYCEARFAPELQQLGADLLKRLGAAAREGSFVPPFKSTDGERDAWAAPSWADPDDDDAARWLMSDLPENKRRVVARLVAAGATGATTGTVLAFGGYGPETSASPVFKAISGRFRRVGRKPLWNGGEQTPSGQNLPVLDETARKIFDRVIKTEYPELAAELTSID